LANLEKRILTAHAGSLPRPRSLDEMHGRRCRGEPLDEAEFKEAIERATAAVIKAQLDASIDIGNDGDAARESFFTYIRHRMTGFWATSRRKGSGRQMIEHPDFLELMARRSSGMTVRAIETPTAVGPIEYRGTAEVER